MVQVRRMILTVAMVMLIGSAASAAVVYEAELLPELVRPSSGASAYGQATLIVNDAETQAHLTVNFAGLDSDQVAAHLLRAAPESPGSVLSPLPLGTPLAMSMDYEGEFADALESGELAVQITSENWPEGAIRGNFLFVIVGVDQTTWSQVKTLFE
jgi:hypothetical protein